MLFNKYKNQIEELQKDVTFWKNSCNDLQNTVDELKKENSILKNTNDELNNQLIDINMILKENEIMKKYYKLYEEHSFEVQAKVLADLRIHDMEYKQFKEKLDEIKAITKSNGFLSTIQTPYSPYFCYY